MVVVLACPNSEKKYDKVVSTELLLKDDWNKIKQYKDKCLVLLIGIVFIYIDFLITKRFFIFPVFCIFFKSDCFLIKLMTYSTDVNFYQCCEHNSRHTCFPIEFEGQISFLQTGFFFLTGGNQNEQYYLTFMQSIRTRYAYTM